MSAVGYSFIYPWVTGWFSNYPRKNARELGFSGVCNNGEAEIWRGDRLIRSWGWGMVRARALLHCKCTCTGLALFRFSSA